MSFTSTNNLTTYLGQKGYTLLKKELTPEQEQSVSVKPTEPTPKAPKAEPPTPPRRRTFVAVKAAAPVAPVGELICTAAAKDILPKPKRIFVAVPKKERKWVAATDLVCTVNVKQ